jgi:AcrR family transcriptional regulator
MKDPARERIRKAAIKVFTRKGYAAAATREICDLARVTKPVLYYHFGSKEHLFGELIHAACKEMFDELEQASRRASTARERLVDVLAADFALTSREPELAALHFRLLFSARSEGSGVDFVKIGTAWIDILAGIVRDGVRAGEVKGNPREIAMALLGTHLVYTMGYILLGKPKLDRRLARRIVDLTLSGCGEGRGNR